MIETVKNLKFSVIIPSYNEGEDVRLSIESALNQTYALKEIIVVDDSNDNTRAIIGEYEKKGVKLIFGERKGCCGARNLGMKIASGDIVVLLNADVILPPDFLDKISFHYKNGADYVLVESRVFNTGNIWARFVEMQHRYSSRKIGERAEWTEGFSCRRTAALKVGLIPGDFPVRFCRDWFIGRNLNAAGFKKIIDLSIIVTHKAPGNFSEYWKVRKARGRFGAYAQHFLYKKSLPYLAFKFFVKHSLSFLSLILIIPALIKCWRVSSFDKNPLKNIFPFLYAYILQEIARAVGEWEGVIKSINLTQIKIFS